MEERHEEAEVQRFHPRGELQESTLRVWETLFIEAVKLSEAHMGFDELQAEVDYILEDLKQHVEQCLPDIWARGYELRKPYPHQSRKYYPGMMYEMMDSASGDERQFEAKLSKRLAEPWERTDEEDAPEGKPKAKAQRSA